MEEDLPFHPLFSTGRVIAGSVRRIEKEHRADKKIQRDAHTGKDLSSRSYHPKVLIQSVHIFTAFCIDLRIRLIKQNAHACVILHRILQIVLFSGGGYQPHRIRAGFDCALKQFQFFLVVDCHCGFLLSMYRGFCVPTCYDRYYNDWSGDWVGRIVT